MEYIKKQNQWIKENNLKTGDKVKITRKAKDYEKGWHNTWDSILDGEIGNINKIVVNESENDCGMGVYIKSLEGFWYIPYFVLEKVNSEGEEKKYVDANMIFSNGSEFMSWEARNCDQCANMGEVDDDGNSKCHIETAIAISQMSGQIEEQFAKEILDEDELCKCKKFKGK